MSDQDTILTVAQMTDIHIGFDQSAKPEELNRVRFRQTLARLKEQPSPVDMLVLTGDLTDRGDRDSNEKMAELLEDCPFPLHPLAGNHDNREELLRVFPDCPTVDGFMQYAVENKGLRMLMLDTFEPGRHGGAFCETRAAWLSDQLAAHPNTPTLLFLHHPPVVSGIAWMDPGPNEKWMQLLGEAIAGHDQILAMHCGHLHRPLTTSFQGIPLGVTPSVAPPVSLDLRSISTETPDNRALITTEPPVYALHRWDGSHLVTHYETVSDWNVLAWYGPHLQPMIRELVGEKE